MHAALHALAAVAAALALLAGCAVLRGDDERIVEVASGRTVTREQLLAALRASDYVLLGELHDNGVHHRRRGELLAMLAMPGSAAPAVVAEQLERGQQVRFGADLQASLVAAGFDAKGWQWPIHEPLFAPIARAGMPLIGGNAGRDIARQVARSGASAVPAELGAVIDAAPLSAPAQAALDADLFDGHCGMLPAARLGGMRAAQRARDASMWLALRDAGTRPAVLVAGNGHVRTDFGVPQLASAQRPQARAVSVGFLETGADPAGAPYTYVWITARAERGDPCAGMRPVAPAASAAAAR
jgi:uncharacterized iron-regulated protein